MRTFIPIVALLLLSFRLSAQSFQVGAAQAAVNPAVGSFIAGHTQNRTFTGLHDSLYTKAVAVSGVGGGVVFLTVDCIGLLYPELESIRGEVAQLLGTGSLPQIVLSSTHSHAGPDVVGIWGADMMHSGRDSTYISGLVRTAARQVVRAWNSRVPVRAVYSEASAGKDWVYNISQPGELDRSLTTLQFVDQQGRSVATLTNFACHPTFVDAVHDKVSADFVSGLYKHLDSLLGGANLFLQGPIGGWVQPEYEAKTFEQAEFRGRQLADTVISALRRSQSVTGEQVLFRSKVFNMPVVNPGFLQLSAAGVIQREMKGSVRTEIAWIRIGNATFATHPGETVPAMGIATKTMMAGDGPKMVLGLGMDALGYILKPEFFDPTRKIPHSDYLCSMSAGKDTGPIVMEVIAELAKGRD